MDENRDISWHILPGNKYSKGLDSAMDSDAGYIISQRIKCKGQRRSEICNVCYDREYLIEILAKKVIKPLAALGRDRVFELISLAWDSYYTIPVVPTTEANDT